jgi:hypothetical protein
MGAARAGTYHALMDAGKRAQNWQAVMDLAAHNHAKVREACPRPTGVS